MRDYRRIREMLIAKCNSLGILPMCVESKLKIGYGEFWFRTVGLTTELMRPKAILAICKFLGITELEFAELTTIKKEEKEMKRDYRKLGTMLIDRYDNIRDAYRNLYDSCGICGWEVSAMAEGEFDSELSPRVINGVCHYLGISSNDFDVITAPKEKEEKMKENDKETVQKKKEVREMLEQDMKVIRKHFPDTHRVEIVDMGKFMHLEIENACHDKGRPVGGRSFDYEEEQQYPEDGTVVVSFENNNFCVGFSRGAYEAGEIILFEYKGAHGMSGGKWYTNCWKTADNTLKSKGWIEKFGKDA